MFPFSSPTPRAQRAPTCGSQSSIKNRLSSIVYRLLLPSLLLPFLSTCGPAPVAPATSAVTTATATVRYQQDKRLLEATVQLDATDAPAPTLLGTPLEPLTTAGAGTFRTRRVSTLPAQLRLGVTTTAGEQTIDWNFSAPFADSLPPTLSNSASARIPVLDAGLTKTESLVMFFEPRIRTLTPRRLQLVGPTSTGYLTLRKEALADIAPGDYRVYFVKQQLQKDTTGALASSIQTEYFTISREVTVTE